MAISLKNSRNCQSNDKVAPFLNRLVAVGAGHKVIPNVSATGQLLPPSEHDKYVESEQWFKMRHEKGKDLVLTFGEDEVRVFKRTKMPPESIVKVEHEEEIQTRGATGVVKTLKKITTKERVDVSGLKTIPLPKEFMTLLDTQDTAAKKSMALSTAQLPSESMAPDAQQLGDMGMDSQGHAHRTRSGRDGSPNGTRTTAPKQTQLQSVLGQQLDPTAPPSFIPIRMWQQWIHARCREDPNSSTVFLDELNAQTAATIAKKSDPNRRRRRHHRMTCIYHLKSTNNVARQMGRAKLFPTNALHQSYFRVQHAIHGASIHGNIEREDGGDDVEKCFVVPDMCEQVSVVAQPPAINAITTPHLREGGGEASSFAGIPDLSAIHEDVQLPLGNTDLTPLVGNNSFGYPSGGDVRTRTASGDGVFSMTQPTGLLMRACTPNLAPFERSNRTLVVHGEFADCSCTDRSTDDEKDIGAEIREERDLKRRQAHQKLLALKERRLARMSKEAQGSGSDDDDDEERRAERLDARRLDRNATEPMIADRAAVALGYWRDRFRKANVEARAHLNYRLSEREQHRAFVTNERTHLHLLSTQAEAAAKQISLVRQARASTPADTSIWAPVFDTVEGDRRYLSSAQEQFISFCEFCVSKQFPSNDAEMAFILDLRQLCLGDAQSKPSSAAFMKRSQTPMFEKLMGANTSRAQTPLESSRANRILPPVRAASVLGNSRPPTSASTLTMGSNRSRILSKFPATSITGPVPDNNLSKSIFTARVEDGTQTKGSRLEVPAFTRFNEETAMEMFYRYGPMFVRSRGGVAAANHLREECKVTTRDFLTLFYSREEEWGPFCPEMGALKKRLNQVTV